MKLSSKLALLSIVAMIGAASPAAAQSFDPEMGTGNVQPFDYVPGYGPRLQPYAMVRTPRIHTHRRVPGDSIGYERLLATH